MTAEGATIMIGFILIVLLAAYATIITQVLERRRRRKEEKEGPYQYKIVARRRGE